MTSTLILYISWIFLSPTVFSPLFTDSLSPRAWWYSYQSEACLFLCPPASCGVLNIVAACTDSVWLDFSHDVFAKPFVRKTYVHWDLCKCQVCCLWHMRGNAVDESTLSCNIGWILSRLKAIRRLCCMLHVYWYSNVWQKHIQDIRKNLLGPSR